MPGRFKVAMLGLASLESIPVYHYDPGGVAVRVVYSSINHPVYRCDAFTICVFGEGGRVLDFEEVDEAFIMGRARAWGAASIFLDGLEPLNAVGGEGLAVLREEAARRGYSLGARTLGLSDPELAGQLDYVVVDYVRDYALDYSIPGEAVRLLYELLERGVWVEVSAYIREPDAARIHPLLVALEGREVPLHVYVEDHKGGGPVTRLYGELSRRVPYVYIHNDLYPRLDTVCPSCGAPVASRDEGVLRDLELRDGSCWRCGRMIPVRGSVRKKTPSTLLLTVDKGGLKWYHPSQLVGGLGFWGSRM